ncbi:MAG: hypothetical protein C0601_08835 [Candidatus Muiribacterium halophilum]|uniref:UspA domain-containing protein n=1 Tax=Muiribacterium halophilum TaxID=2053465 RepID=A0A2N5ZE41_MUIH1|nr:MAG: hypothetical protein C0601_08835 [Candidatus Muirbacterium halophilum]
MYNILLAIDNSDFSRNALEMSIEIAQNIGAKINVLFVIENKMLYHPLGAMVFNPVIDSFDMGETYSDIYETAREKLRKLGKKVFEETNQVCQKKGVETVCYLREGILAEEIKELAFENDLVVMGRYGLSSKYSGTLLGSAVEEVCRIINRPLLLVPEKKTKIRKIAVAYDNSLFAQKTFKLGNWMDSIWKDELKFEMFSVVDDKKAEKEMQEILEGLTKEKENFTYKVLDSIEPASMILNHVQENDIDLLMMGAYGHSRIRELILGSTTSEVLRKIDKPVLLYR